MTRTNRRSASGPVVKKFKSTDLNTLFGSIDDSWIIQDLVNITNTTDVTGRWTRKIRLLKFQLQGLLVGGQSNLVTDDAYNGVRIVLFEGAPGLASVDFAGFDQNVHLQPGISGITRIFMDRMIALRVSAPDSTGYVPACTTVSFSRGVHTICVFDQSGAAYPAAGASLYLAMISDSAAVSNPGFTIGHFTLTFIDVFN